MYYELNNFMKQVKEIVSEFLVNGEIADVPWGNIGKRNLSLQQIKLLRLFTDLVINTRIIQPETKMYISNKYITYRGVADHFKIIGKETLCESSIQSIAYRDKCKLESKLGKDILRDIIEYSRTADLDAYEERLLENLAYYGNGSMLDKLKIKLPEEEMVTDIDDDTYYELLGSLCAMKIHT
ncbi:MAG TPA: hypothetical protein DCP90_03145, partial [Clostridiales bacterium]|nr:hypothetical protein [Clostridiales bacterium]